ncbi:MAG: 30S ribosomal protein S16 [Pyrinomonadaceae bacterium]
MLAISLMRMGAKGKPFYRLVVKEKRSKRDGKYLENVGTYDPMASPADVNLNHERIQYWISVGAQPTETVQSLIKHNPVQTEEERAASLQARADKKAEAEKVRMEAKKAEIDKLKAERIAAEQAAAEKAAADKAAAEAEAIETETTPEAVEAAPGDVESGAAEASEAAPVEADAATAEAPETVEAEAAAAPEAAPVAETVEAEPVVETSVDTADAEPAEAKV